MAENFRRIIHNHAELADAIAELRQYRGISNETLEQICLFTRGHVSKMLGPTREKAIGKSTLQYLLLGLAGRLILECDPEQELLVKSRWEGRNHSQVRVPRPRPISKELLERAKQIIFAKHTRKATLASIVARQGKGRHAQRRNGHNGANGTAR